MVYMSEAEKNRKLAQIREFCDDHNIRYSKNQDSYYFTIRGTRYRVSNHTVEASNKAAYRRDGTRRRELYHPNGREKDTVYIHASHFRIPQIYMDLRMGRDLDGRGRSKPRERVVRCRRSRPSTDVRRTTSATSRTPPGSTAPSAGAATPGRPPTSCF